MTGLWWIALSVVLVILAVGLIAFCTVFSLMYEMLSTQERRW